MSFEDRVLNKLDGIQKDISDIKVEQAMQGKDIKQNTEDLTDHKEGVIQNRKRIVLLEEKAKPITVKQLMTRIVLVTGGIGTIVGCVLGLMKLLGA